MENHYNCIYLYINKINGKGYVGKAEDFLKRKRKHIKTSYNKKSRDYNVPFHRAIRKYGIESFEVTILKENLTKDEMNYWEDYYIETFDLYAKNGKGYNLAKGGTGGNTIEGKTEEEIKEIYNDEWKQKQSEAKKGKNNPRTKRIIQHDKQGNLIRIWDYAKQVTEELGINHGNIIQCCKGKRKSAGGFVWKYVDETK